MQDLFRIFDREDYSKYFEQLFDRLSIIYKDENESIANVNFHHAVYLFNIKKVTEANELFKSTRSIFSEIDKNHYVIKLIDKLMEV